MPNFASNTAPSLKDEERPSPDAGPVPLAQARSIQPGMSRPAPVSGGSKPALVVSVTASELRPEQHACCDALSVALKEGHVFAALTGPAGCGKTTVLEAVIAELREWPLRWIRIRDADKVPGKLAEQIEQVAYAEARKPENRERQVVLVVDDAQAASEELMRCLTRLAAMREPGRRVPQVLLVGGPELWDRLAAEEYGPLQRRLAIRAVLPLNEPGADSWASVEQELRHPVTWPCSAEVVPEHKQAPASGASTLRQDVASRADSQPRRAGRHYRLLLPLGLLLLTVAAAAWSLSHDYWPDMLRGPPWTGTKPVAELQVPQSPARVSDLPRPTPQQPATPAPVEPLAPSLPGAADASGSRPVTPDAPASAQASALTSPAPEPPEAAPPQIALESALPSSPAAVTPATITQPNPPTTGAAVRTAASPLAPEMIALLLQRGGEQVAIGDFSAARLLYQRAAEAGSARGARLTARTYDEAFLPPADANMLADHDTARAWYARAASLGDAEAARRLKTLDSRR